MAGSLRSSYQLLLGDLDCDQDLALGVEGLLERSVNRLGEWTPPCCHAGVSPDSDDNVELADIAALQELLGTR
jgi:hypothetical protein